MRLLTHEVHINDKNCINTSLAIASFFNLIIIMKLLLKQDVNVDELNRIDFTSLQLLCRFYILNKIKKKLRMLDFLLKHKVNLNKKISCENTLLIKMC